MSIANNLTTVTPLEEQSVKEKENRRITIMKMAHY